MTTFMATTEGTDKLGLRAVLKRYANDQWLPDYYDDNQTSDHRPVRAEFTIP